MLSTDDRLLRLAPYRQAGFNLALVRRRMEVALAALLGHPIKVAPYTAIRFSRQNEKGTPLFIVGPHEAGGAWKAMKAVQAQHGSSCFYCGKPMPPDCPEDARTIDHVLPEALGGTDDLHNLVFACQPCNTRKAALPIAAFSAERCADFAEALNRHLHQALAVLTRPECVASSVETVKTAA